MHVKEVVCMSVYNNEYLNPTGFEELVGKLLYCDRVDGKGFVARLESIRGDFLCFRTKGGELVLNRIVDVSRAHELTEGGRRRSL